MKTAVLAVLLMLAKPDGLSIRVNRQVLTEGQSLKIACRVEAHPDNRTLTIGVENYQASGFELFAADASRTYEETFWNIPCGSGPAFCHLERSDDREIRRIASLNVVDCDPARRDRMR